MLTNPKRCTQLSLAFFLVACHQNPNLLTGRVCCGGSRGPETERLSVQVRFDLPRQRLRQDQVLTDDPVE